MTTPLEHAKCWLAPLLASGLLASSSSLTGQTAEPAPAEAKKPKWETTASLGLTLTRGNSKNLLFTGQILTLRKWEPNELSLGADASYGESEGVKNNEAVHGFIQYNRLFSDRFYGYARVDALHDAIADVEYRITLSPGAGYYFIKNERTRLSAEVGPGAVIEKVGHDELTYLTLRLAERFEHKLNDRARIWQTAEWLPQVDDLNNYILNTEAGLAAELTKKLELKVYVQDTYDNEPAPGRLKNDVKLVSAIGYRF